MRKSIFLCISLLIIVISSTAQYREDLIYGIKAGAIFNSTITNADKVIMSETFFTNYSLTNEPMSGVAFSAFANWRPGLSNFFGLEFEVGYAKQGTWLDFINTAEDFNYQMHFKYQYLNMALLGRLYLNQVTDQSFACRFSVGGGFQVGVNVAGNEITYKSGGAGRPASFGSDLEQQQQLRNVLKGKNNVGTLLDAAYEFHQMPVIVGARYHFGLGDVIDVMPNSYNFVVQKTKNNFFRVTIGFYIGRLDE